MPEVFSSAAYTAVFNGFHQSQDAVSPLDQAHLLDSGPDDEGTIPRYYFAPRYSPTSTYQPSSSASSPKSFEDFPTPKASLFDTYNAHNRESQTDSDFDSLYDMSDTEAEVPLKCSASVKKIVRSSRSRSRYPSILIPSPSTWPTIEKLQSAMSAAAALTPNKPLTPSRHALSLITSHNLLVPARSAAPSLDGSLTSEEMDKLSCPSTPDSHKRESLASVEDWAPVQLDLQALETLQHLGRTSLAIDNDKRASQAVAGEMQEVSRPSLGLTIPSDTTIRSLAPTPLSELSIPSPGGFFSSLQSTARHTWSMPKREESAPNTSTAEKFYQLPWESRRNTLATANAKRSSTLAGSTLDGFDDGLPTARPVFLHDTTEVKEINPSKTIFQYNTQYNAELKQIASVNLERTGHWLEEQDELQAALRDMSDLSSPSSSSGSHSRGSSMDKTVKKSVTFAEAPKYSEAEEKEAKDNDTYVQGFQYLRNKSHKIDPFIHRQTRAEAMHVHRSCMPQAHRDQLLGKFELTNPVRPAPSRPVSEFYVDDPTVLKERIARAQMERQALDQILPSAWVLQALKQLNGGKLLSKPAARYVSRASAPRILDVGGVATNDWAWQVAFDYSHSSVTTVYTAGGNLSSNLSGPENHKHMTVPNLWTLPFPSRHFDVVSARSLYELLKTDKPLGRSLDEYDLCLKECYRVLKPGGILDFSLLDADIIHAARQAQAMGVEFGFNLKTRGYDAAPSKSFLPRLHKAGFRDVQRMWMVLPMGKTTADWKNVLPVGADGKREERSISPTGEVEISEAPVYGTTTDAALMTGVVGSWMWEKWMLKLQMEMGKDEEKLLEGVVQVLEEGAQQGSGWRYLMGYARK
jgi:SAM-dependent methyltransferase